MEAEELEIKTDIRGHLSNIIDSVILMIYYIPCYMTALDAD